MATNDTASAPGNDTTVQPDEKPVTYSAYVNANVDTRLDDDTSDSLDDNDDGDSDGTTDARNDDGSDSDVARVTRLVWNASRSELRDLLSPSRSDPPFTRAAALHELDSRDLLPIYSSFGRVVSVDVTHDAYGVYTVNHVETELTCGECGAVTGVDASRGTTSDGYVTEQRVCSAYSNAVTRVLSRTDSTSDRDE